MSKVLQLRVSDSDYDAIREHAKLQGKTVSDYIRDKLLQTTKSEHAENEKEASEFIKTLREIHAQVSYLQQRLDAVSGSSNSSEIAELIAALYWHSLVKIQRDDLVKSNPRIAQKLEQLAQKFSLQRR